MATTIELDSDLLGQLTEFRRDLHSHPELGFQETRTAARVAAALRASGVDVTEGIGGTGLVGTIRGVGSGDRSIGLLVALVSRRAGAGHVVLSEPLAREMTVRFRRDDDVCGYVLAPPERRS